MALHSLDRATDLDIWLFARANAYAIVTKDSDFNDVTALRGAPPKIIWVRVGNCTTTEFEQILRRNQPAIEAFLSDPVSAILELV